MKKLLVVFACILLSCAMMACSDKNDPDSSEKGAVSEYDNLVLDLQKAMEHSTHIIDAVYTKEEESASGVTFCFAPIQAVKGSMEAVEDVIYVQLPSEEKPIFQENGEYLLVLEKNISVYYEHSVYVLLEAVPANQRDWEDTLAEAKRIAAVSDSSPKYYGTPYSDSDKPAELLSFASNVFCVKINDIYAESTIAPTTVYQCTVTAAAKGMPSGSEILVTLFKDTVSIGEEYVILLADAENTKPVYTLAAKKGCVYTLSEASAVPELERMLSVAVPVEKDLDTEKSDQDILREEEEAR